MKKYENIVQRALVEYPITRKDDFLLYATIIYYINPELIDKPIGYILRNHKDYKLPAFESISRARRNLQRKDETLCDEETLKKRKEREFKIRKEYSRYEELL